MKKSLHFFAALLAALLVIVQPLQIFAASSDSLSVTSVVSEDETDTISENAALQDTAGYMLISEFDRLFLSLGKVIPAIIDVEDARARRHIKRCSELEESLCEFVFENEDDTFSEYLFDFPVKFYDSITNAVQDISLKISKTGTGFQTSANSIKTYFSKYLSKGITLDGEKVSISLFPCISREVKGALSQGGTVVSYTLDKATTLDYSLTYLGFKENIVVSEYTGCTEYRFTMETNGLKPEKINGSWFLTDEKGEICATIGDIIIFTADEANNTLGDLDFYEIENNRRYEAVITLDSDYLKDSKTKYPICIDPTIEVVYNSSADAGKLADVTLNSKTQSVGAKDALYIGRSNTAGIQRVLMKFPGLNLSKISSGGVITKAEVELRDLMCQYWKMNVNCHVFTGNTWNESTAGWSNVNPNSYVSKPLSTCNVNYTDGTKLTKPHRYSFDITEAVIGWKEGYYNINKGLIFKADDSFETASGEAYKTFGSYNRASYKPSLCITYSDTGLERPSGMYYIVSKGAEKYLGLSNGVAKPFQGSIKNLGNSVIWRITNCKSYYLIQTTGTQPRYLVQNASGAPKLVTLSSEEVGTYEPAHWMISTNGNNRQATIKNLYTNKYMYMSDGGALSSVASLGTYGSQNYINVSWYVLPLSYYGKGAGYSLQELTVSDSTFNNMEIARGKEFTVRANNGNTSLFSDPSDFTYTSSNTNVSVSGSSFTSKEFGTATITATHRLTGAKKSFTIKVLKKAIIIVPGIFGSNLKYPNGKDAFNNYILKKSKEGDSDTIKGLMSLINDSRSNNTLIPIEDYGTLDAYKPIINEMNDTFSNEYDIRFFAYDWRKSCIEVANKLKTLSSEYDKITYICHSMGGLVLSYMISQNDSERNKVEKAFFVATPFFGAPLSAFLFAGGDVNEFYDVGDPAFSFLVNFLKQGMMFQLQSAFELLPTEQSSEIDSGQFMGKTSYDKMVRLLGDSNDPNATGAFHNAANQAKAFHARLWNNGIHITNSIQSYYIYGKGEETIVGGDKVLLWPSKQKNTNGDGIVPDWSAALNWKYGNTVEFSNTNSRHSCQHLDIISNPDVLDYIVQKMGE